MQVMSQSSSSPNEVFTQAVTLPQGSMERNVYLVGRIRPINLREQSLGPGRQD